MMAKHLLRHLAGAANHNVTCKRGGSKLGAFSDVNWSNNPDNGKSISQTFKWPHQLQGGTTATDGTIDHESRAYDRSSDHGLARILLEHIAQAGVR